MELLFTNINFLQQALSYKKLNYKNNYLNIMLNSQKQLTKNKRGYKSPQFKTNIMKSLAELYELLSIATKSKRGTWFINFSGHVNRMWVKYYPMGWKAEGYSQGIEQELTEEGIQALYWFVRTRLNE